MLVELTKSNKQAEQEKQKQRKSVLGNPMSILDLYQHSLYGHFGEDGPEQLTHFSLIEQLSEPSGKDSKDKESPSNLKQTEETKEDPQTRLSKISLESLNKFNSNNVLLLEKEKNCLNKAEGQKEESGKKEASSLNSSDRQDMDNLESLSDSLYDSFSSCASQGSNDVWGRFQPAANGALTELQAGSKGGVGTELSPCHCAHGRLFPTLVFTMQQ